MPAVYGGSISAVCVNRIIYFCGGITTYATRNLCGKYSINANTFLTMASLPTGVNHASIATDNQRIYVFGGRCVEH